MKLRDYMPTLYDNNGEMNALLYSEEQEFENSLKPNVDNVFNDTFVMKATVTGIENFEKLFGIVADETEETMDFRRQRLISRLISQIPFTERFLQEQLDKIIGEGQWEYELDCNAYTLDIYITIPGRSWLNELNDLLDRVIPCNIDYEVHIYAASWQQVKENFATWGDIDEMTWDDVKNAEWIS